jgi:formylglycine-generating enzyme required for sulfatase activity
MGCNDNECFDRELPQHQVTLKSYRIAKYPVTQKQWVSLMGSNPSYFQGDDFPVEMVSWLDVQDFIKQLNDVTGRNYRLATDAEWEYAARGGKKSQGYKYSGSNNVDDVAWYDGNSGFTPHAVGTKAPNELGIYDMSGNVMEWCNNWYAEYTDVAQTDPQGPATGLHRVIRNGSWATQAQECRVSFRNRTDPESRHFLIGFRIVLP